ncbi:MAG: binding-protein-dependent transport permease [Oscillospiraceae bacterium]|nr:binding-protein-dependent transport permease [Oscillospiraceae bacterium]
MGKAILAAIVTVIVGVITSKSRVNAPEMSGILAVAVMGAFIIYFNDKKK